MRWLDLNQRPLVYETNDLTGLIYIASIPCGGAGGVRGYSASTGPYRVPGFAHPDWGPPFLPGALRGLKLWSSRLAGLGFSGDGSAYVESRICCAGSVCPALCAGAEYTQLFRMAALFRVLALQPWKDIDASARQSLVGSDIFPASWGGDWCAQPAPAGVTPDGLHPPSPGVRVPARTSHPRLVAVVVGDAQIDSHCLIFRQFVAFVLVLPGCNVMRCAWATRAESPKGSPMRACNAAEGCIAPSGPGYPFDSSPLLDLCGQSQVVADVLFATPIAAGGLLNPGQRADPCESPFPIHKNGIPANLAQ